MLQEKFKTGLLAQSEEFKKQVASLIDEFQNKGPFTSNIPTDEALTNITGNVSKSLEEIPAHIT